MTDSSTTSSPHICSKTWCHTELPANYRWKTCNHCRECDRKTKRTQRASEKAKKAASVSKKAGSKRRKGEDTSDTSDTSEDEQPTRHRKENVADGIDLGFLDDEDDMSSDEEEVSRIHKEEN